MTGHSSHLAVGAIVRRGTDILLVPGEPDDAGAGWALPGGTVAGGESLLDRVTGETGLTPVYATQLLWVARYPVGADLFETLVFEVIGEGTAAAGSEWVPVDEAVERLARMWFAPIRIPAVAYLTGWAPVATVWRWDHLDADPETLPPLSEPVRS